MGDLSKNLSKREFACKCGCGFDATDMRLVRLLQQCVDALGDTIIITSGCRCVGYNRKIGGAVNSQHIFGVAADFKIYKDGKQVLPGDVADWLEDNADRCGIGRYKSWVHLDTRGSNARWSA